MKLIGKNKSTNKPFLVLKTWKLKEKINRHEYFYIKFLHENEITLNMLRIERYFSVVSQDHILERQHNLIEIDPNEINYNK